MSFFREKTGVLPDSVNFLSFIDNLHETGPSEPGWGAMAIGVVEFSREGYKIRKDFA